MKKNTEIETKIQHKIIEEVKLIENKVVDKLVGGKYSLLIGESELIEDFCIFLKMEGIKVEKDIHYFMTGPDRERAHPLTLIKVNRQTGNKKTIQLCMIKKSDKLIKLVRDNVMKKEDISGFDAKKLLIIELENGENGKGIYSNFLGKDKELTKENVAEITRSMFNPEMSIKEAIDYVRKEDENDRVMYG